MGTLNDLVNDAIQRWVAVTQTDPARRTLVLRGGVVDPWSPGFLTELLGDLNESRDLDPSGLTTFLLLRGLARAYLEDRTFPALALLEDRARVEADLAPLGALRDVLEDPRVAALTATFKDMLRRAADHYGLAVAPRAALDQLLDDPLTLAWLRRDAFRSATTLEAHQFLQGRPGTGPFGYNPEVWEFWNLRSLLHAMQTQPADGVSIALIRDMQDDLWSFFVLAIRHGETLTVLTDREKVPHPAHKRMSRDRATARTFVRREAQHWFPYQFVGAELAPDQRSLYVARSTALVPVQAQGVPVGHLRDFGAPRFVWTVLLFALLRETYGVQHRRLPATSYTADMLVERHALCGPAGELVRKGEYAPLALPPVTAADMQAGAPGAGCRPAVGYNRWMTERYGAQVPEAALNVLGAAHAAEATRATLQALDLPRLEHVWINDGTLHRSTADDPNESGAIVRNEVAAALGEPLPDTVPLDALDPLAFGTAAELDRDRQWIARKDFCTVVNALAVREFEAERDGVAAWYRDRIAVRVEALHDAAAAGTLDLPAAHLPTMTGLFERAAPPPATYPALRQQDRTVRLSLYEAIQIPSPRRRGVMHPDAAGVHGTERAEVFVRGLRTGVLEYRCSLDDTTAANLVTEIRPTGPAALAALLGLERAALPWPLLHWYEDEPYVGNSILQRLDPEDWHLTNPWRALSFRVVLVHSKRALNARRKRLGLPPRDWSALRPRES